MPLLQVSDLHTHYGSRRGTAVRAVDGVSFSIGRGETVGLVGESGCGKSTLGRTLLGLAPATSGTIELDGQDLTALPPRKMQPLRRRMQMIFQDPFASLNPRQNIEQILTTPLAVHRVADAPARRQQVLALIDSIGLPRSALQRYPHEFSGGQRQRIGIARALILRPDLVVCDEPVSALDLSIQAQILNLLSAMKRDFDLSYLFISHDLSVIRYVADRVLVMYLGRIVESADRETIWSQPQHPYTRALLQAVPDPSRRREPPPLPGDLPSPQDVPTGCRFRSRCPHATDLCVRQDPAHRAVSADHYVACHHPGGHVRGAATLP